MRLRELTNEATGLSPATLSSYKKKASAEASALDKEAFEKGGPDAQAKLDKAHKRYKGINKATQKQFDNDAKGIVEMDSQGYTGSRDGGDPDAGKKEYYGKAVKAKDVAKQGLSYLHKAFDRALSKEKKASPAQVQRNKERWTQRQAEKNKGVEEGTSTTWEVSYDYGPHMTKTVKVKASSEEEAAAKVEKAAEKKGLDIMINSVTPATQVNEFAPDGFNGGDDGDEFSPEIAKMAQEDGFTKGVGLADGATLERAITINHWHSQHGGMYKQYFAKGFKAGRMEKIRHDNRQYNLNLKLMKDGSIRHGVEEGWKEKVGAAALAGAVATGASANTPKVPLDKAIQQATAVYNINKAVKKHKEKEAEKRKADEKQVKEQGVAEGSEERSQKRLWAQITDYEQRAKATKNDIKRNHYLKMASELRGKLKTTDDVEESQVNEISTKLRDKYVTRATDDYGHANFAARASKSHPGLEKYSQEQETRAKKRAAGLNRALSDKRLGRVEESNDNTVSFEVDSERAYNHIMDKFGHVIEWDGDAMVIPSKYWGAVQELAYAAGGEATEYNTVDEASLATMRDYFAGDENAKDEMKITQMRKYYANDAAKEKTKKFNSLASYHHWLKQVGAEKINRK